MFSRADADQLKQQLPAIRFGMPAAANPLLENYNRFYGLDLETSGLPVIHSFGSFSSGTYRLACHHFALPPDQAKGTVFLVHGYYDHAGLYSHVIHNLLAGGRAVVIFDLPGHGLSTGHPASIDSFDTYRRTLQDCLLLAQAAGLTQPWSLVGQSTGAAVIMHHLLDRQPAVQANFEKCILLAPLLRPQAWIMSLLSYYILHWFARQTRRHFAENSHDREFLDFLRHRDPLQARHLQTDWVQALIVWQRDFARAEACPQPVDIIQGTEDTTVDWKYNLRKIERKFPAATTWMVPQGRHHLANESEELRGKVLAILNQIFGS